MEMWAKQSQLYCHCPQNVQTSEFMVSPGGSAGGSRHLTKLTLTLKTLKHSKDQQKIKYLYFFWFESFFALCFHMKRIVS